MDEIKHKQNGVQEVEVLKDKSAIGVFGDDGKDGVILITSKTNSSNSGNDNKNEKMAVPGQKVSKEVFVVVEEMPTFPGGYLTLKAWLSVKIKYPEEAFKNKISGRSI